MVLFGYAKFKTSNLTVLGSGWRKIELPKKKKKSLPDLKHV